MSRDYERLATIAEQNGYPQHAKLHRLRGENDTIAEFLVWVADQGLELCRYDKSRGPNPWLVDPRDIEDLIADYYEIDRAELAREKQRIALRMQQAQERARGEPIPE